MLPIFEADGVRIEKDIDETLKINEMTVEEYKKERFL